MIWVIAAVLVLVVAGAIVLAIWGSPSEGPCGSVEEARMRQQARESRDLVDAVRNVTMSPLA